MRFRTIVLPNTDSRATVCGVDSSRSSSQQPHDCLRLAVSEIENCWNVTRCHYQNVRGAALLPGHENSGLALSVKDRKRTGALKIFTEGTRTPSGYYKMTHYDFFNDCKNSWTSSMSIRFSSCGRITMISSSHTL